MQLSQLNQNRLNKWSISSELISSDAEKKWFHIEILSFPQNLFYIIDPKTGKKVWCKNVDCSLNTSLAFRTTKFKDATYFMLEKFWIRIPKTRYILKNDIPFLESKYANLKFPVVTKPIDGTHGDGVAIHLSNFHELREGLKYTFATWTPKAIVQEQIVGEDYRIIVVWGKMIAAALRTPPFVVGDGKSSIQQLIDRENKNPLRGEWNHTTPLSQIKIDEEVVSLLAEKNLKLQSILPKWEMIFVRKNANLSTGGWSIDVTDLVHQSVQKTCENAAKAIDMEVAAIDFMCSDISKDIWETKGAIIEINHTPGLRMHHFPSQWTSRDVAWAIVDRVIQKFFTI